MTDQERPLYVRRAVGVAIPTYHDQDRRVVLHISEGLSTELGHPDSFILQPSEAKTVPSYSYNDHQPE